MLGSGYSHRLTPEMAGVTSAHSPRLKLAAWPHPIARRMGERGPGETEIFREN